MGKRIYYSMQRVIVYFYLDERICAAKQGWLQEARLKADWIDGKGEEEECAFGEECRVMGCAVAPFYYRKRPWKPQALSEAMEDVLCRVEGMVDTYPDPQVEAMLTPAYGRRWQPDRKTLQMLAAGMISAYAGNMIWQNGEVTVLLGAPPDADWQMDMTRELIAPYLTRVNRMLIFYEEVAGTDIWMELDGCLEEYYYEYGLVPQLEPYGWKYTGQYGEEEIRAQEDGKRILRCGTKKCGGVILDYAEGFRYPRITRDSSTVYIDLLSEGGKERLIGRKTAQTAYVSPLKYLDTMVKNSYDRLVN